MMGNKKSFKFKLIISLLFISIIIMNNFALGAIDFSNVSFYYIYENIIVKALYIILGILILLYIYSIIKNSLDDRKYLKKNEVQLDQIKKFSKLLKDQNKLNENNSMEELFKEKNDVELEFAPLYTKSETYVDKELKELKIKSEKEDKEKYKDKEKQDRLTELGINENTSDVIEKNYNKIVEKENEGKEKYEYKSEPNILPIKDDSYYLKFKLFNELEKIMEEYEFDLSSIDIETFVSPEEFKQIHIAYRNYLKAKEELKKKEDAINNEEDTEESSKTKKTKKVKKSKTKKKKEKPEDKIENPMLNLDGVVLRNLVANIRESDEDSMNNSSKDSTKAKSNSDSINIKLEDLINEKELKEQTTEEVKGAVNIVLDVFIDKIKKLSEEEAEIGKKNKISKKNLSKLKIKDFDATSKKNDSDTSKNSNKEGFDSESKTKEKAKSTSNKRKIKTSEKAGKKTYTPTISLDEKIEKLESFKETIKTSDLFKADESK